MRVVVRFCGGLAPLLLAAACGGGTAGPNPPPPPPTQMTLAVLVTDGVTAIPGEGTAGYTNGTTVAYRFELVPGYRSLEVRLDNQFVSAIGTVRMDQSHDLHASAFPIPPAPTSPEYQLVRAVYDAPVPAAANRAMLRQYAGAALREDLAAMQRLRAAESAVLEQVGPDGLRRVLTSLAGTSVLVLGDSIRSAAPLLREPALAIPTFPDDTVVPTTVIYVNGILNFTLDDASRSAAELTIALKEAGFSNTHFISDPASARQSAGIRVYVHYNPVIALQNPVAECASIIMWALTTANGVTPRGQSASVWLRVRALLDKVQRVQQVCTDPAWLSTNARAVDQFFTANAQLLSPPNADDRALLTLIEQERVMTGGRDVLLVAHSQGTLIARTAVSQTSQGAPNVGCVGTLAIASPLTNAISWPRSDAHAAIIQKGAIDGSADILYFLGAGRTDGRRSSLTDALDKDISNSLSVLLLWPPLPWQQLQLHSFADSYLNPDGHRAGSAIWHVRFIGRSEQLVPGLSMAR